MRAHAAAKSGYAALLLATVCLLAPAGCERTAAQPDGPNVLIITIDTTRADHLSCYGWAERTSEHLDKLAAEGALFANAIAQAAVTPVSHATILTGQNPYTHGLRVMHGRYANRLRDSCVTLAEVLRAVGYQTAAFVSAFPVTRRFGLHQGFETFDADFIIDSPEVLVDNEGVVTTGKNQRRADETTDRALAWLAEAREPFCLWVHYFDPHDVKLLPPAEFTAAYPRPSGPLRDWLRATYDVEIRYMDQQIGRLLDHLRQAEQIDDMVIVVVADHGEGLGDHDWWTHGILYQEQIRVPLILRAPSVPHGTTVDHLVRTIDIMPTVLELAGVAREKFPPMDGTSLIPLLADNATDPRHVAYADSISMPTYPFAAGITDVKNDMLFCASDGAWKYIHHALRPTESELYNLKDDPRELSNLYASHPEQVARLLADLRARKCFPHGPLEQEPMSAEDLERLRSLGYITETLPATSDPD